MLALVTAAAGLLLNAATASANPPGAHDAIGHLERVKAPSKTTLQFAGWVADPDALTTPTRVIILRDGAPAAVSVANVARPDVARIHHTGPTPGFEVTVPVPSGPHTFCAAAANVKAGLDTVLGCVATPYGTRLTPIEVAAHSPIGAEEHVTASKTGPTGTSTVTASGWAADLDDRNRPATVVVYVDGTSMATVLTKVARPDIAHQYGTGADAGYTATVTVSAGTHLACVWVVNVGLGANASQRCTAVDTRGPAGITKVNTPAVNAKVIAEAKNHLGQQYVWGAAGPSAFDCSGLVQYSYHKAGVATPRIAADQFAAARLIPATRAVPGDLVFYHDAVGDVYHVGIYTGPGQTIAAVDEQEGIRAQTIWDPFAATYGSFTHT